MKLKNDLIRVMIVDSRAVLFEDYLNKYSIVAT